VSRRIYQRYNRKGSKRWETIRLRDIPKGVGGIWGGHFGIASALRDATPGPGAVIMGISVAYRVVLSGRKVSDRWAP